MIGSLIRVFYGGRKRLGRIIRVTVDEYTVELLNSGLLVVVKRINV